VQIDPDILDIIRSAAVDGMTLRLPDQLDPKVYKRTDLVIRAAGGQWNRYKRAHQFPGDAANAIAELLATGQVITDDDRGYFPTPEPIVERLLALAEIEPGCELLEPSAGRGAIAKPAVGRGAIVDCVEIDEARAEHIRSAGYARKVITADFLDVKVERRYQRAVLNPPFGNRQDVRHVERALRFVEPGGLVVAVMSANLTFLSDRLTKDFRARVQEARGTITELPDDAFPSKVRTVVAVIPVRDVPAPPRYNRLAPRPEDFRAQPRAVQQDLFLVDPPTRHGTTPLHGLGYGATLWAEIDPNSAT
jgi:predicted RNA methylase